MFASTNHLLAALGDQATPLLAAGREMRVAPGDRLRLDRPGVALVAFPLTGLVSSRWVGRNGGAIETGVVGVQGAVGLARAMGGVVDACEHHAVVETRAWAVPAAALGDLQREEAAASLLWRHVAQENDALRRDLACANLHPGQARLAERLLLYARALEAPRVQVTQDALASALGLQRTTVTAFVGEFARRGLIRRWRGALTVVDEPGLARLACGCRTV